MSTFSKIGKVEKLHVLGRGAMGAVWKVRAADGAEYALKTVDLTGLKPGEQKRALNEVRVLKRLRHPNIVQFVAAATQENHLEILQELVDGGDLAKFLAQHSSTQEPLDEVLSYSVFVQVCQALKFLHAERCIHRDVKPSNIFLTRSGEVKLGDFGVSKLLTESTVSQRRTCVGSPYYMAPEICDGEPYEMMADVWSLGCLLFELCAAARPFEAPNLGALVLRITKNDCAELPDHVSPELARLVRSLLVRDPAARPSVAALLEEVCLQPFVRSNSTCSMCIAQAMGQTPVDGAGDSDDDDWEGGSVISDGSTTASNKGGTTIAPERTRVPESTPDKTLVQTATRKPDKTLIQTTTRAAATPPRQQDPVQTVVRTPSQTILPRTPSPEPARHRERPREVQRPPAAASPEGEFSPPKRDRSKLPAVRSRSSDTPAGVPSALLAHAMLATSLLLGALFYYPMQWSVQHYGLELPYERHIESEADYLGCTLMARAGFNPQAAIDLWQDFADSQERSGVEFVEWTSTHPSHEHRSKWLEDQKDIFVPLFDQARGVGVKHWTEWALPHKQRDPITEWAKTLKANRLRYEERERKKLELELMKQKLAKEKEQRERAANERMQRLGRPKGTAAASEFDESKAQLWRDAPRSEVVPEVA